MHPQTDLQISGKGRRRSMKKQAVIIKSEKSGIHLILDEELAFPELLEEIIQKFKESEKFFQNAKVSISFGGRNLSEEEENQIVNAIMQHTSVRILCILDHNALLDEVIRKRTQELLQPVVAKEPEKVHNRSSIYRGSLRKNQVLESKENLLILGDVPEGATVIAYGDVIVLGSLYGNVQAGADEDRSACIAATHFAPGKLMIGSVCYEEKAVRGGLFARKNKNKTPEAKAAFVSEGIINIVPLEEYDFSKKA